MKTKTCSQQKKNPHQEYLWLLFCFLINLNVYRPMAPLGLPIPYLTFTWVPFEFGLCYNNSNTLHMKRDVCPFAVPYLLRFTLDSIVIVSPSNDSKPQTAPIWVTRHDLHVTFALALHLCDFLGRGNLKQLCISHINFVKI